MLIGKSTALFIQSAKESATAVEHILEIPIVGIYSVENGEYAAENGILPSVEHIACVGTNLVITR